MNKDKYAAMFSGTADTKNQIHVRIVTWDELSASALNTVTDVFTIEVSLGCMDDRIVPPPQIALATMMMESDPVTEESIADNVVISLGGYLSEQSECRSYAEISVERLDFITEEYTPAGPEDPTRLVYL
jgi:flagellar motor switch protein FliG